VRIVLYEMVRLSALIISLGGAGRVFQMVSTSIGIPPEGTGGAGLRGMGGRAD